MAVILSPYTWRVVWSATYSTSAAANNAYNAVNALIGGYSVSPRSGRYSAGLNLATSTFVTASFETDDEEVAKNMANDMQTAYTSNRTNVLVATYRGNIA